MKERKIHLRAFVSLLTTGGFILLAATGIILFIVPEGRIAYWTNWTFLCLTKKDWGNIHIVSGLVFVIAGSFHAYFNWKPLKGYVVDKVRKGINRSWELAIALCITIFLVAGAIWELPPLNHFLKFNESVKDSWIISEEFEPPFGHAELLSLKGFARKMDIDLNSAFKSLRSAGINVVSAEDSLEKIAKENNTSPMKLFRIIKPEGNAGNEIQGSSYTAGMIEEKFAGTGVGNRTLEQVCVQLGLDCAAVRERLAERGMEIQQSEKLRESAERYNMNPLDLLKAAAVE